MKNMRPDETLKAYWSDKRRFADFFNAVLFEGEEVLFPNALQETNTAYAEVIPAKGESYSIASYRDVVKMAAYGSEFAILGLENQQKIHYAMPIRSMLYDALGYVGQCHAIAAEHRVEQQEGEKPYKTDDEYLSRMTKEDKLKPIFTVVLYYGNAPWDGPRSLLDMVQVDERLKPFLTDYSFLLLDAKELYANCSFGQSWKIFFDFCSWQEAGMA